MQQSNEMNQEQDLAGDVTDSLGMPEQESEGVEQAPQEEGSDGLPLYAKERLGKQEKRHRKEMRQMQEQIASLHDRIGGGQQSSDDGMPEHGSPVDEQIRKAVTYALNFKEMEAKQAKEQEGIARVHQAYQDLDDHLDEAGSKYDDFHEVVRDEKAPFSKHMRDTATLLPNAADVLYKLGKNHEELKRVSALHPMDQAKEMIKLSIALMTGGDKTAQAVKPLGQLKASPVTSPNASISGKTSVSELRQRLRSNR